jgi:hypothetical protein
MRPGAPAHAVNGSKEIGLFVAVIGSLSLRPQYNKRLALGQESFASIAAIHRAEGCALVTEEFRSSPEANIEDRLRIALFHACRRE